MKKVRRQRNKLSVAFYTPTERDRDVFDVLSVIKNYGAREVADRSGVSTSTVYNWRRPLEEGGTRYPRYHTMHTILRAFGHKFKVVKA